MDHSNLLSKLELAGLRGSALVWFNSFLSDRIHCVRIADQFSAPLYIKAGVMQDSILSVTLFLVFINDLLLLPFNGNASTFVDDIAYFYSEK